MSIGGQGNDEFRERAEAAVASQETAARVASRQSSTGSPLPIVGVIVDAEVEIDLESPRRLMADVGSDTVELTDGVFDDDLHIVVVHRSASPSAMPTREHFSRVKALELVGVEQVLSSAFATFDYDGYVELGLGITGAARAFVDLSDAPALSASLASTSCRRLLTGLSTVASARGFEPLPEPMLPFVVSGTGRERVTASALSLCYAALDVLVPATDDLRHTASDLIAQTLLQSVKAVSPLATCSCVAKH